MQSDPYLTPYIKINSKWTKDVNVRATTITLSEGNTGLSLHDFGLGNGFLNMTPKHEKQKNKNQKIGLHQN